MTGRFFEVGRSLALFYQTSGVCDQVASNVPFVLYEHDKDQDPALHSFGLCAAQTARHGEGVSRRCFRDYIRACAYHGRQ